MRSDLFGYDDYRSYVLDKIRLDYSSAKGVKLSLSKHIGCQSSYLSQVFRGKAHFTLEQAVLVNSFFSHDRDEAKYFVLLVEHARAGTPLLRHHYNLQLNDIKAERFNLKKRLKIKGDMPESAKQKYYSSWFYSAIHCLLGIEHDQDIDSISRRLNLPVLIVSDVVHFLEEAGLIKNEKGIYKFTENHIHLSRDSVFIRHHHLNWRTQAMSSILKSATDDMHYSNVMTISRKDYTKIKERLASLLEDIRPIIKSSNEEDVFALTIDYFKI